MACVYAYRHGDANDGCVNTSVVMSVAATAMVVYAAVCADLSWHVCALKCMVMRATAVSTLVLS
jgi:hypothetical protein